MLLRILRHKVLGALIFIALGLIFGLVVKNLLLGAIGGLVIHLIMAFVIERLHEKQDSGNDGE